jgi:hypothetical protein
MRNINSDNYVYYEYILTNPGDNYTRIWSMSFLPSCVAAATRLKTTRTIRMLWFFQIKQYSCSYHFINNRFYLLSSAGLMFLVLFLKRTIPHHLFKQLSEPN